MVLIQVELGLAKLLSDGVRSSLYEESVEGIFRCVVLKEDRTYEKVM